MQPTKTQEQADWRDQIARMPTTLVEFFLYAQAEAERGPIDSSVLTIWDDTQERWLVLWKINKQGLAQDPEFVLKMCSAICSMGSKPTDAVAAWIADLEKSAIEAAGFNAQKRRPIVEDAKAEK